MVMPVLSKVQSHRPESRLVKKCLFMFSAHPSWSLRFSIRQLKGKDPEAIEPLPSGEICLHCSFIYLLYCLHFLSTEFHKPLILLKHNIVYIVHLKTYVGMYFSKMTWVWNPAPSFTGRVILGKSPVHMHTLSLTHTPFVGLSFFSIKWA